MALEIIHAFESPVADAGDPDVVGPDEWNAPHTFTLSGDRLVGRMSTDGPAQELTPEQSRQLLEVPAVADLGYVTPQQFGAVGDGATDDTAAFKAARDALADAGRGKLLIPAGEYVISEQVLFEHGDIEIDGAGSPLIIADFDDASTAAIFAFAGAGETAVEAAPTGDITPASRTVAVDDATGFAAGDYVLIESDEYWGGIDGLSGYEDKTKGEINRIRFISGNTLTLEKSPADTYTLSGHTVTITKAAFNENIAIRGVRFYGTGNGNSHDSSNPTGVRALRLDYVDGVDVEGCGFENFPRIAVEPQRCLNFRARGNRLSGRDLTAADNQAASPSVWFTGFYLSECDGVTFEGNVGEFMRRHFDIDGETIVSRNIAILGNTALSVHTVVGTHACERVTISGNVGDGEFGVLFRGKDAVITGNVLKATNTGIQIGATGDNDYSELASSGRVVVSDNVIELAGTTFGIRNSVDVDDLSVIGNRITGATESGISVGGRRVYAVTVADNRVIDDGPGTAGIDFPNAAEGDRILTNNVSIVDNVVEGYASGVRLTGGVAATPTNGVLIAGNILDVTTDGIRLRAGGVGSTARTGFFGENIIVGRNIFRSLPSNSVVDVLDVNRYSRMPVILPQSLPLASGSSDEIAQATSTSIGNHRTVAIGQRIRNTAPADGANIGWVCTVPGTTGTLSGKTGSISSASADLTLNDATGVIVGTWLSVAGAGVASAALVAQVLSVAGNVVTLSTTAGTTVAAAAVTYRAPTFVAYGGIGSFQPLDSDLTTIAAANNGSVLAATTASFTTADESKLDGVEALADVTDAANVGAAVHGSSAKTALHNNDKFAIIDTEASNVLKTTTWANIKSLLTTLFDATYAAIGRTLTAGAGLTGGGTLAADRTFAVGAGTGITVNADDVALDTSNARNVDHSGVTLTAGAGLTGGGDISASRSFAVGAGTGIVVNADDVAVDAGIANDKVLLAKNSANSGEVARFTAAGIEGLTESEFKTAFNLVIGTNVQAWDAQLDTWATVTPSANGQSLVSAADYTAMAALLESAMEAAIDTLANLGSIQGVSFTFGAYSATLLNNANEAAFKAAVNLEAADILAALLTVDGPGSGIDADLLDGLSSASYKQVGKETKAISAAEWNPTITNGAGRSYEELATNDLISDTLDFDTTTQEFATYDWHPPKKYDGGTVTFRVKCRLPGASAAQTVDFALSGVFIRDDDALDAAPGTPVVVTDTFIATGDLHVGPESGAVTFGGTYAAGCKVALKFQRNPSTDNAGGDAKVEEVEIFYTSNAATDA